ncbi:MULTISPECIES: helix-turn-helix domain-containing protein [Aquimarina]|uniref:Helix-turn-helix domain-containing protein n=1 Tax=Aquimarina algiphila TaxID=2047982 RepID=A0A554VK05_9FLAO|nr:MULTISPECIES: response regulator transcription factor [Aquimarina]TSE08298.1 helix-turn-helix domain-containing protein [Aquimarina algiphila]
MILSHKTLDLYNKRLFEKAVIKPPFNKPNPMPNEACFLYVIEGEYDAVSETKKLRIKVGESVLMKCGNFVSKMLPDKKEGTYEAIAVHFYPDILKKAYGTTLPSFLKKYTVTERSNMVRLEALVLIKKYIDSILFYFENPSMVNEDILVLKLKEIILLLLQTDNSQKIREILSNLFIENSFSFNEIIEAHIFSSGVNISDLAMLTNTSLSSFKRKFKKIYNDSPNNYIRNKRLNRAADLLLISELSISNIAYDCGFNDIAHFSKSFKQKFSISPSIYKLNQKHKMLNE